MINELSDLLARLGDMTDATKRHKYDIGDYWNVCEEAEEVLKNMQDRLLATAPSALSSPPKCEDCADCGDECSYPGCFGGNICASQSRMYDHCVMERRKNGTCGPSGRLFVKKGGKV